MIAPRGNEHVTPRIVLARNVKRMRLSVINKKQITSSKYVVPFVKNIFIL